MTTVDDSTASIGWDPRPDDRILLAGNDADLPVIQTILAALPAKSRGQVFLEVQAEADVVDLVAPGRFAVCWLVRDRGQALRRSVDAWLSEMLPTSAFDDHSVYAWIARDGAARTLTSN
jgi:NADPH-dependent ferric siderophore reductase